MLEVVRSSPNARRAAISVVVLLVALVGFPASAPAARYRIKAVEDSGGCGNRTNPCWNPGFRHILKGDVIVWKNPASNRNVHDVTAINKKKWSFQKTLNPGEKAKRRFRSNGKYKYRCTIHSRIVRRDGRKVCKGMCGVVHVGN